MIPLRVIRFVGFSPFRTIIDRFTKHLKGHMELVSFNGEDWMLSLIYSSSISPTSPKGWQRISFRVTPEGFEVRSFDVEGDILWDRCVWVFAEGKVTIERKFPYVQSVHKPRRSMVVKDYSP